MLASLNGSVKLDINDGEWSGISFNRIRNLLAGIGNSTPEAEATAMPFSHFVLEANIQNGISSHSAQAAFTWPAATMTSSGKLNLASNEITEDIRFKGNAESQALPIRVSGKMDNPSVSLNFQQITSGSTTTARPLQPKPRPSPNPPSSQPPLRLPPRPKNPKAATKPNTNRASHCPKPSLLNPPLSPLPNLLLNPLRNPPPSR